MPTADGEPRAVTANVVELLLLGPAGHVAGARALLAFGVVQAVLGVLVAIGESRGWQ